MVTRRTKSHIAFLVALICLAIPAVFATSGQYLQQQAHVTKPSPQNADELYAHDGFPEVDWDHWRSINADIIGWVTIPGTNIDHPIVQAQPSDPQRYLWHDIYGNQNPYGAIYLDAECANEGLDSLNTVIFGHNMGGFDQGMFGDLEHYPEESFARTHQRILIQTPTWKRSASVGFVTVSSGRTLEKRLEFEDADDYQQWFNRCFENSTLKLSEAEPAPERNFTFVTCSYQYESDERTLVFAY